VADKSILVTGGAGFIGSHTIDLLLMRGYRVKVLDNLSPPVHEPGKLPSYLPVNDIEFIEGDVRDKSAWMRALDGAEAVIHLAAYQDYLPDFSKFFHVNTVGTALLYETAIELGLSLRKVVIASSQATYGEAKYACATSGCPETRRSGSVYRHPALRGEDKLRRRDWNISCCGCEEPLSWTKTDEAVVNPHNQYAVSKYTQELVSLNLGKRYGIPTVCMRYSIVQGARQSFRNAYSGVLRIFSQRLLANKSPICYEDGAQIRDYVSVSDVARANLIALEDARVDLRSLNVGGDRAISVLDYGRLVASRAGKSIEPEIPGLYRFGDTRHVISDVSGLGAMGWSPCIPLGRVIDEYLDWCTAEPGFGDFSSDALDRMRAVGTLRVAEGA
jgi:dTDP-L-rhamnose 4-epimerase